MGNHRVATLGVAWAASFVHYCFVFVTLVDILYSCIVVSITLFDILENCDI